MLVIELLQGATFALGWSAGCLYVKRTAPRGTRATVQVLGWLGVIWALLILVKFLFFAQPLSTNFLSPCRVCLRVFTMDLGWGQEPWWPARSGKHGAEGKCLP